mmetsp:Transcript_25291/g.45544  ORF Transcript_25291/g.45544 Transcript_25291/m.45544 type:complete len:89 (+) Transcript_25291:155-421(+)
MYDDFKLSTDMELSNSSACSTSNDHFTHGNVINHFPSSHDDSGSARHHDSTLKCTLTRCGGFFLAGKYGSSGWRGSFGLNVGMGFLVR